MGIPSRVLIAILCSAIMVAPTEAATVFWDGGARTNSWNDALNWSTDALPGVNDDVIIDTPLPTTVDICCGSGTISVRSIECHETLFVRTGTLSITNESTIPGQLIIGQVSTTVQLTGAGDLVIVGSLIWTRGTISGGGHVVVRLGASVHVESGPGVTLTRGLLNSGDLVIQDANLILPPSPGGIPNIRNTPEGTITLVSNVLGASIHNPAFVGVESLVVNEGVMHVQGGLQSNIAGKMHFENSGSVILESGGLTLGSGFGSGTNEGTIEVTAGTLLELADDFVHDPRSRILGAGQITFKDGIQEFPPDTFGATGPLVFRVGQATFEGAISPSSVLVDTNGIVAGETGTAVFNGPIVPPIAIVNHGTVIVNGNVTLAQLEMSSVGASNPVLAGDGVVVVADFLDWVWGTMSGSGRTVIPTGASAQFRDGTLSREMDVDGTLTTVPDSGPLLCYEGTLNIHRGGVFNGPKVSDPKPPIAKPGVIHNDGLIQVDSSDPEEHFVIEVPLENTGHVLVSEGLLVLRGGGTNAGVIEVLESASCTFESTMDHLGGSMTIGPGHLTFQIAGNVFPAGCFLSTGSLDVLGTGALTINNPSSLSGPVMLTGLLTINADQSWPLLTIRLGGTLGGSADFTMTQRLRWERGSMIGTGRTIVAEGATFEMNSTGDRLLSRSFLLGGEHTVYGFPGSTGSTGSSMRFQDGTLNILPTGKFVAAPGGGLSQFDFGGGVNQINCAGVFEKRRGFGTTDLFIVSVPFYNAGTVDVIDGILELHSLANYDAGTRTLAGGSWILRQGATIQAPATVQPLRLGSSVTLFGPYASFAAISFIDTILANGALSLRDRRQFIGIPLATGTFLNQGSISVEEGSQFASALGFSEASTGHLWAVVDEPGPVPFTAAGAASVSGALHVALEPGFVPSIGHAIPIMSAPGGVSGAFDLVELPDTPSMPCSVAFDLVYQSSGIAMAFHVSGSPDLFCDGLVDSIDLATLLSSWSIPVDAPGCGGAQPCPADINGDGFVNALDLGILLASWTL